jgi:hypothetical protein
MCYDVYMYDTKLTTVHAKDYTEAVAKMVKLYGLEITVIETGCEPLKK